jgi:transcriptional regulator with XRE-family HTH domain
VTALSEALAAANTAGLTGRQLSRSARERGFTLNHDTVARYLRGDHGRPDELTLRAFASVLDVDLTTLRRAADLPADQVEPYVPPLEASRLSRRQRRAVDEIIRAMLEPSGGSAHLDDLAARRTAGSAGVPVYETGTQAARRGTVEPPPT